MKTKNLIIIILFLPVTLGSGLVVFLTGEKEQPVLDEESKIINSSNQPVAGEKKQDEVVKDKSVLEKIGEEKTAEPKLIAQPEKIVQPAADVEQAEQVQSVILINGAEYRTAVKPGSSVYDLMTALNEQKKIDFKGSNYSGLGFFVEEINGIKNNPAGKNWVYYINGKPAPVGISSYKVKSHDIIEWKYEKKLF